MILQKLKNRCHLIEYIWICSPIEIQKIIFEFLKGTKSLWQGRKPLDLWNVL
jgi:hypothetical protein